MKVMLFLGSGVSRPSGMPSVEDITKSLLEGAWVRHTDSFFYPLERDSAYDASNKTAAKHHQEFLADIKRMAERNMANCRVGCNYEELYSYVLQILDGLRYCMDPLIRPFISELAIEKMSYFKEAVGLEGSTDISDFLDHTLHFIACVVRQMLMVEKPLKGLCFVKAFIESRSPDSACISTLNHDCLLERFLEQENIEFTDGFDIHDGDVALFTSNALRSSEGRIPILKLHGSVNWWRLAREDHGRVAYQPVKVSKKYIFDMHDGKGKRFSLGDTKPTMLVGTLNKATEYYFDLYAAIHNVFYDLLWETDVMVVSGYGWRDHSINVRLLEWLGYSLERKLFIIHREPETIRKYCPPYVWRTIEDIMSAKRIVFIEKWFEEMDNSDLSIIGLT